MRKEKDKNLNADFESLIKKLMVGNPDYRAMGKRMETQVIQTMIEKQPLIQNYYVIGDRFFYDYMKKERINEFSFTFSHWEELGNSLICQAVTNDFPSIPGYHIEFDHDAINSDVEHYTKELLDSLYLTYAERYMELFYRDIYVELLSDLPKAAEVYKKKLLSSVPLHEIWYAYGDWQSPKMELFNHYTKLLNLGQSIDEVDEFIKELKDKGLVISSAVMNGKWRKYIGYIDKENFLTKEYLYEIAKNSRIGVTHPFTVDWPEYVFPAYYMLYQEKYIIRKQTSF